METKLTPMQVAERLIGPPDTLGPIAGVTGKRPYAWRRASNYRDAGDFPSPRIMRALYDFSCANDLGLTLTHLVYGADAAEVDAILAARQPHGVAAE